MTSDEYRNALLRLEKDGKFREFTDNWGGAQDTVEKCVQAFAYSKDRAQWERIIVYRVGQLGVLGLKTEDEKLMEAAQDSAKAAKRSADSAAESASSSRRSLVVAAIALLASIVVGVLTLYTQ